jgi:hypothetical protein
MPGNRPVSKLIELPRGSGDAAGLAVGEQLKLRRLGLAILRNMEAHRRKMNRFRADLEVRPDDKTSRRFHSKDPKRTRKQFEGEVQT